MRSLISKLVSIVSSSVYHHSFGNSPFLKRQKKKLKNMYKNSLHDPSADLDKGKQGWSKKTLICTLHVLIDCYRAYYTHFPRMLEEKIRHRLFYLFVALFLFFVV